MTQRVYPIAWHLDVFDGLGWEDTFAIHENTERARKYAANAGIQPATPQSWVNGVQTSTQNEGTIQSDIDAALSQEQDISVTLWPAANSDDTLYKVFYKVKNPPADTELTLVLVERELVVEITAGENEDNTLEHENVVRAVQYINEDLEQGIATLELPDDVIKENCSVIGYLQDIDNVVFHGGSGFDL